MKIVIGFLLAVNLITFVWITQTGSPIGGLATERATNMPPLMLLSEKSSVDHKKSSVPVEIAPAPNEVDELVEVKQPILAKVVDERLANKPIAVPIAVNKTQVSAAFFKLECYSLGAFSVKDSLIPVISSLEKLGIKSTKRYETRSELSGYWVYIPPLPSREDARKVVSMLRERGVNDYQIVSTGINKHAISLGFFSTSEGAVQHKTHMQTLGLAPAMDESYKESSGFWLDFASLDQPALPNKLVDGLQNQYDGISMKKRQCLE